MLEIRLHGRAGQGAKTIAQLLAESALESGKFIQAFPAYGPARSGAAMNAFVRISDKPIQVHSQIKEPDLVLVIDPLLVESEDVLSGLKQKGIVLINSSQEPIELKKQLTDKQRLYWLPASRIAKELLGRDMPNTVLLGALIRILLIIDLKSFLKTVEIKLKQKMSAEVVQANLLAIKKGYSLIP